MNWRLALLWLAAVVSATFLTWQIVNVADSRVSAQAVEAVPLTTTTSTVAATGDQPTSTTTIASDSPSTTVESSPATTGTAPPTTPPTESTLSAQWSVRSINTQGGTLVIRYRPEDVELQSATPAPGYDAEIDDAGPEDVRVEFNSEDLEVRVEVEWENGELSVDVEES